MITTSALGDLVPSSGLRAYLHTHVHTRGHMPIKITHFKNGNSYSGSSKTSDGGQRCYWHSPVNVLNATKVQD